MALRPVRVILRAMQAIKPTAGTTDAAETDLIRKAKDGDRPAFDRLVELHLPRVWATVFRVLRHREDTEDVVQDVFITAHRSLSGFRGEARLSTWLHRIAISRAINHLERAESRLQRASSVIDPEAEDGPRAIATPLHVLEARELMSRLGDCLKHLPAAWKVILALRDAEQGSYEQIAETLHVEIGTVRSRLARARGALKDCVEGKVA